jgi:hypothetical protein
MTIVVDLVPPGQPVDFLWGPVTDPAAQIPLWDVAGLLAQLGVTREVWAHWAGDPDAAGAEAAAAFVRNFPAVSKLAFLPGTGPVRLAGRELSEFVEECRRARQRAEGSAEAELFVLMQALAERAVAEEAEVGFGFATWLIGDPDWVWRLETRREPAGWVHLVGGSAPYWETTLKLWDLADMYERLGLRDGDLAAWHEAHGYTLVLPDGRSLVPGFPLLSEVYSMLDVEVTSEQLPQLIGELERAEAMAAGTPEAEAFRRIRALAQRALAEGVDMEFAYQ